MRANRVRHRYKVKNPSRSSEAMGNDVGDLATDVVILKNEFVGLKSDLASLATAFQLFSDEYRKAKQWNWSLLTPLFVVGTAMMALLGLLVQNQISPMITDVKGITLALSVMNERMKDDEIHAREEDAAIAKSTVMDTRSETDRASLRADTAALQAQANENSAGLRELKSVFERTAGEVETQIAHVEQVRDAQVSGVEWKLALIWPQVFHQPYPVINTPKDSIALRGSQR